MIAGKLLLCKEPRRKLKVLSINQEGFNMEIDVKNKTYKTVCYAKDETGQPRKTDILYDYEIGDGEEAYAGIVLFVPDEKIQKRIMDELAGHFRPGYIRNSGFLAHGETMYAPGEYDSYNNEKPDSYVITIDAEKFIENEAATIAKTTNRLQNPMLVNPRFVACYHIFEQVGQALRNLNARFENKSFASKFAPPRTQPLEAPNRIESEAAPKLAFTFIKSQNLHADYAARNNDTPRLNALPVNAIYVCLGSTEADNTPLKQQLETSFKETLDVKPQMMVGEQLEWLVIFEGHKYIDRLEQNYDATEVTTIADVKKSLAGQTMGQLGIKPKASGQEMA